MLLPTATATITPATATTQVAGNPPLHNVGVRNSCGGIEQCSASSVGVPKRQIVDTLWGLLLCAVLNAPTRNFPRPHCAMGGGGHLYASTITATDTTHATSTTINNGTRAVYTTGTRLGKRAQIHLAVSTKPTLTLTLTPTA